MNAVISSPNDSYFKASGENYLLASKAAYVRPAMIVLLGCVPVVLGVPGERRSASMGGGSAGG